MFLAAVARLRWGSHKNYIFNEQQGMWTFAQTVNAKKSSRNRPDGIPVTKPIESVNSHVYQEFLFERVLLAIREK